MADTTVNAAAHSSGDSKGLHPGRITWLTPLLGGCVFLNGSNDVVGVRTTDGGVTWGASVAAEAGTGTSLGVFADVRVVGDNGTKIHAAWVDSGLTNFQYAAYDIATNTWSAVVVVDAAGTGAAGNCMSFITKTRAGGFIAGWASATNTGCYKSDAGVTWASCASPFEVLATDYVMGIHANTDDTKDGAVAFGDISAAELSIKSYDDGGDAWAERAVCATAMSVLSNPFDAGTKLSNGHTIIQVWNATDAVGADCLAFDCTVAAHPPAAPTQLTNVLTDSPESGGAGVFVDQANGHYYYSYLRGTAFGSLVKAYYKVSTDSGVTVSAEQPYSEAAEADLAVIFGGEMGRPANGGRFQPIFYNDTLKDLFVNLTNDVEIAAVPAPTVSSATPSSGTTVGGTSVVLAGTGFLAGATVTFGGSSATGVVVDSSTQITCVTPAHAAGAVNVVVTNTDTQAGTLSNGYTYVTPSSGRAGLPSLATLPHLPSVR